MGGPRHAAVERGEPQSKPALWMMFALALVGCGPREVTWQRDHIRYTKRVDDPSVTADVLDELIQHRDVIGAYLRLRPPTGTTLTYRKYLDREDLRRRSHCSAVSAGCYFDQFGVESKMPLDAHELIHAYTAYLGTKPKLVEEGLAQALSCDGPTLGSVDVPAATAWSSNAWQSPFFRDLESLYRASAAFVAHLLRIHGPERFMTFYGKLAAGDELPAAAAKFEDVFGETLTDAWAVALANRDPDRSCVYPVRCTQPPITTEFTTYGSDGLTLLRVAPERDGELAWRFGACDTTPLDARELGRSEDGRVRASEAEIAFGPGRYWLESESVRRTTRPLTEVLGSEQACSDLRPLRVTDGARLLAVSRESLAHLAKTQERRVGDGAWILRGKVDSPGARVRVECSPNVRAQLCEGCDYTSCQAVCETDHRSVAIGIAGASSGDAVLRMHVQDGAGFWVRLRREKHRLNDL